MSIRIGILGYGNLGKGVELAVQKNEDMELVAVIVACLALTGVIVARVRREMR